MAKETISHKTRFSMPCQEVFDFHKQVGAFERLMPPFVDATVLQRTGGIEDGAEVLLLLKEGPLVIPWHLRHSDFKDGSQFVDYQLQGPFKSWRQTHKFTPDGPNACYLEETIEYELPFGAMFIGRSIHEDLKHGLVYRHRVLADDLRRKAASRGGKHKVLVTGSHGLIGSSLVPFLVTQGHTVAKLVRPESEASIQKNTGKDKALKRTYDIVSQSIPWDPKVGMLSHEALDGYNVVVHLAGENIANEKWTPQVKQKLRDSRVKSTQLLCQTLAMLQEPPDVLVCASAIGFYGARDEEVMTENSRPGAGFLPALCKQWESAAKMAKDKGIRVVHLRFGVVLSPRGGALAKMLPAFNMSLGGPIGSGKQWMSWVSIDDAINSILHVANNDEVEGPVNCVAPHPVRNIDFAQTLGRVLGKPSGCVVPANAMRGIFGDMADELLLSSTLVNPVLLQGSGYQFRHPNVEPALRDVLGRTWQPPPKGAKPDAGKTVAK